MFLYFRSSLIGYLSVRHSKGKEDMLDINYRDTACAQELLRLNNVDEKHDWIKQTNELHKLAAYKCKIIKSYDADGCGYYKSKEICELYSMLWPALIETTDINRRIGNKEILKYSFRGKDRIGDISGETLISPLTIIESIAGKRIDWEKILNFNESEIYSLFFNNSIERKDMNDFCRLTGTIGNFMPVPTNIVKYMEDDILIKSLCMQTFHKGLNEQFDRVLKVIQAYYNPYIHYLSRLDIKEKEYLEFLNAIKKHKPDNQITYWLDIYFGSWQKFVVKNYLLGSFVNDEMECVLYSQSDLSLLKLIGIIQARGKVMMQAMNNTGS